MRTAAALLLLCVQLVAAAADGNVVHLTMPRSSLMAQEARPRAHDAHALAVPVLLDFQPALLWLRSDQSIGAQLRWFCVQHGLDPGRCGVVLQHALEELIELRGVVYCKRMAQTLPALLTVRNILIPTSRSLYPPTYAWLHDEAIHLASDLCGFLRSSVAEEVDATGCESTLREALDESFKWISSLPRCDSDSAHAVDEHRISTIEQMIESLGPKDSETVNGILNIITTDMTGLDPTRMVNASQQVTPPTVVIASEEHRSDVLKKSLSDRISTIEQMIASLHSENNATINDSTIVIKDQEEALSDNTNMQVEANQPGENDGMIGKSKIEESILTDGSQSVQAIACNGNCSHESGVFFPDSIEENTESSQLSTDSQASGNKDPLQANGDEDIDMTVDHIEPTEIPAREKEPIDIEKASGDCINYIHSIEEQEAAITEEISSFFRHYITAIQTEASTPWTVMLTLTLLLFVLYLVLDLLSIGIHHLAGHWARQALMYRLNIAFIRGKNAASVFPETGSTKAQPTAVIHLANSKLVKDATLPPADAAGVISAEPRNEIRPTSPGNEQRKAMVLKKVTKTYRRRTQKTAMGLWRSASKLNRELNRESEEPQAAVNSEPSTNAQPTLEPQPQDARLQLPSHAPSFTCAAMTLLFAHHAQYHLPVAKANTTSEANTCEAPALIHSVSVQDIRQLSAAQIIQSAWRAKHKLLRGLRTRKSQIAETKASRKPQEKLRRQLPIFQLLHHSRAKRNDGSNPSLDTTWTAPESDEFFSRIESPPQ